MTQTIPTIDDVRAALVGRSVRGDRQRATVTGVHRWEKGDFIRDYIDADISDDRKGPCRICIVRSGSYRGPTITTDTGLMVGYELGVFADSHAKRADARALVAAIVEGVL